MQRLSVSLIGLIFCLIGIALSLFLNGVAFEMYQNDKKILSRIFLAIAWVIFFISTGCLTIIIYAY